MLGDLSGSTAVVTGAGGGLGRAMAVALAEYGARVAVTDLHERRARETADLLPGNPLALDLDVTSLESVAAGAETVLEAFGPPHILINNAGIASATMGREGARDRDEDWTAILLVNIQGTVRCCEAFLPAMKERRRGKIINVGSMAGHAARQIGGAYATSKAAILRYTKGLAVEVAPFGINVNAVCPGAVWTPLQERGIAYRQSQDPELTARDPYEIFTANYARTIPLGRPQTAEEVAAAVVFLASSAADSITGQCLHVDGGAILRD